MNNLLKTFYDNLPIGLQNLMVTAFSMNLDRERYGGKFNEFCKLLHRMESKTEQEVADYQDLQLAMLVDHAYKTVPYYRRIFEEKGLRPEDIRTRADLCKLPVLTKDVLKSNFEALRSRAFPLKKLKEGHTSGTTGTPMEVRYDPEMMAMSYAALDRQYRWAGVRLKRFGDRVAVIRGNIIVPLKQTCPPFWRFNWYHRHILLSNFHLAEKNLGTYFDALREFRPKVLDGYPSSVYVLAKFLLNNGERFPLKAVLTSSETLFEHQRIAIEEAFQCRIFDYYGAAERVVFTAECECHQGHHLSPEYGITEILGDDGQPVPAGAEGTLVGTSLHNFGMPLIRYASDDRAALKTHSCDCGRPFALMEDVTTKAEDILRLQDGRLISPSVLTHPFKPLNSINGSQLVQTDPDRLIVRLIPRNDFTDEQGEQLKRDLKARLGEDMQVELEYVDELTRTKSGKFKWVISNVELEI